VHSGHNVEELDKFRGVDFAVDDGAGCTHRNGRVDFWITDDFADLASQLSAAPDAELVSLCLKQLIA
jgi:hypothetical protein